MNLGETIKENRIKKNLSQKSLADLVGCGRANIANIESGRIFPSVQVLIKIRGVLGINLNELNNEVRRSNEIV